jgi:hypothetical protein
MTNHNNYVFTREVDEDEWGRTFIELGIKVDMEALIHEGQGPLYDKLFDHLNSLIAEGTVKYQIEQKRLSQ